MFFEKTSPMIAQLQQVFPNTAFGECAGLAVDTFANIRFLDLVPDNMREASFPGQNVIGDSGEHLATALKALCAGVRGGKSWERQPNFVVDSR